MTMPMSTPLSRSSWPSVPGGWFSEDVVPSENEVLEGLEALKNGRVPVEVSRYNVDVFDMSEAGDRDRYCRTMEDLVTGVQANRYVVWKNELQVLSRKDGSSGWHRYLEWSEYRISEEAAAVAAAK